MSTSMLFPVLGQWQSVHQGVALDTFVRDASDKVKQAFAVMMFAHAAQRRKGASKRAYAAHPLMVYLLVKTATNDENQLCAALLHDVVEDMQQSFGGVRREDVLANIRIVFGAEVARLVSGLTNPTDFGGVEKSIWQARHFERFREIQLIKLADKIANAYDTLTDPPPNWNAQKRLDAVLEAARFARIAADVPRVYQNFVVHLSSEAIRLGLL